MSQINIGHGTVEGFDTIELDTGALALTIIPELGGKLSSLRDQRSGREWLWRHPRMPYRRVPHGAVYTAHADTGGWDECFPSVSACAYPSPLWQGAAVQDHGELWSQTAAIRLEERAGGVAVHARWHGVALPYSFERTIHLAAGAARARFEYLVTNTSDEELHFIWSAHPLMAIEPGMRLRLPPAARYHGVSFTPGGAVEQSSGLSFPLTVPSHQGPIDLATLPDPAAAVAIKLWSEPIADGWAALAAPDGEFRLHWDAAQLPQVAVWMNLGAAGFDGGAPYYNMGLEPCIGAQDSLADAVTKYRLFEKLPPRGTRAWWLEVELAV
jgi:galactose mutarotase-like enzyme